MLFFLYLCFSFFVCFFEARKRSLLKKWERKFFFVKDNNPKRKKKHKHKHKQKKHQKTETTLSSLLLLFKKKKVQNKKSPKMKRGKMEMTEEDSYGQTILDPTQDDESFGAIYYDRSHYTSTECTTSPPPSRVHNSSRNSGGSSTPSSSSTPESHWDRLERQKTALLSDISSSKV